MGNKVLLSINCASTLRHCHLCSTRMLEPGGNSLVQHVHTAKARSYSSSFASQIMEKNLWTCEMLVSREVKRVELEL